jgi:hypothetical protein
VLPRLLHYMRDMPYGIHILFSKLDISDGFWQLDVCDEDSFNFAYVLPHPPGEGSANGLGRKPRLLLHSHQVSTGSHPTFHRQ